MVGVMEESGVLPVKANVLSHNTCSPAAQAWQEHAQARGVRFGRTPKLTIHRLADGESQADVARAYNVDPAAICRLAAVSSL